MPMRHVLTAALAAWLAAHPAQAQNVDHLTGDTKLACEVILCLSSAYRPTECSPALNRYYGIKDKKASRTRAKRRNFLNLCPKDDTANAVLWTSLINSISEAAETCTADGLNAYLGSAVYDNDGDFLYTRRSNQLPGFCTRYWDHEWTYFEAEHLPVYIGEPSLRGFWAEPEDRAKAQDRYDRWLVIYKDYLRRLDRYYDCVNQSESGSCRKPVLTWTDPIRE